MNEPDFIPKEGGLCPNCKFYTICPYDWICPTVKRIIIEEIENVHNGDSA